MLQNINPTAEKGKKKDHHLIRIGYYYEEGETIVASKSINDGATPPPLTHRLRTIQRWFSLNIRDIISKQYQNEKLEQIEEWVRAKELGLDDQITYSYNLEPRKDTKQSPVANAAVPLITPTTTAAQTKDADGDNGEGTRKYDMGPNYQDAIPKMTKDKTKHEMTQDAVLDILDRYGLQVKFNDSPENDVDVDYIQMRKMTTTKNHTSKNRPKEPNTTMTLRMIIHCCHKLPCQSSIWIMLIQ